MRLLQSVRNRKSAARRTLQNARLSSISSVFRKPSELASTGDPLQHDAFGTCSAVLEPHGCVMDHKAYERRLVRSALLRLACRFKVQGITLAYALFARTSDAQMLPVINVDYAAVHVARRGSERAANNAPF